MAIYHFSAKPISRADGKSAVACSAYRSGEKLLDQKYGKEQDYTHKKGVDLKQIYGPKFANEKLLNRSELWNEVEKSERRKDSLLAREFEIAFPCELSEQQRKKLLDELCSEIVQKYNVIVDACIHAPHTKGGSDERNYHAHIMFTTRSIDFETGMFSAKKYRDFNKEMGSQTIKEWRKNFADITNKHLEETGLDIRIDHRSNKERGLVELATIHEGVAVTQLRRQGIDTEISLKNNLIKQHNIEILKNKQIIDGLDQEIVLATTEVEQQTKNAQIEIAAIRASAFHQKYLDFAKQIDIENQTASEQVEIIERTGGYQLAVEYVQDFELLKSVNREPQPEEIGLWGKLTGKKPNVFYDIQDIKDNISLYFKDVFQNAETERKVEAKKQQQLIAEQEEKAKQKRREEFMRRPSREVEELEKKHIALAFMREKQSPEQLEEVELILEYKQLEEERQKEDERIKKIYAESAEREEQEKRLKRERQLQLEEKEEKELRDFIAREEERKQERFYRPSSTSKSQPNNEKDRDNDFTM